ncbi:hypothetical protein DL96DRAFT_410852 [Flagelloscypha sp. PMI_526]|nr:hypothetical protein DL96DRAFT_410852 [Flagelloscypha sp. PMI_526]
MISKDPQTGALLLTLDIMRYYQCTMLVITLSYGIYLPLFWKSVILVKPRLKTSVPSRWLFSLIILLFFSTTIHFASGQTVNFTIPPDSVQSIDGRQLVKVTRNAVIASQVSFYSGRINISLIDAIVVWRAYVLQSGHHIVQILLIFFLTLTILFSAAMTVLSLAPERFKVSALTCNDLNIVRDGLALALNIVATLCIASAAWRFSRDEKHESASSDPPAPFVNRVFQVMLEGGVILAIIQIITIILGLLTRAPSKSSMAMNSPELMGFMIITEILIYASAVYPSLITILVAEERSTMIPDNTSYREGTPTTSNNSRPPSLQVSLSSTNFTHEEV